MREIDIGSEIEKGREIKREGKRIKVKTHLQKLEQNIRKIVKTNKKQSNMWCYRERDRERGWERK